MQKKTKSILQFVILFAIGILLVWLSLRAVAPQKDNIINSFANADYFWVFVSIVVSIISHVLRAYRWNYLLEPLGYKVKFINSNCHVLIGYFANYGIPRMGEVTRCTSAAKYDDVPFQVGFGTVITERIIDTALFLIIFLLTLLVQFKELINLVDYYIISGLKTKLTGIANSPTKLIVIGIVLLLLVGAFFIFRKKISGLLKGKLGGVVKGLGEGLGSIRKTKKPFQFIVLSFLIWACYFYSLYFCFFAIEGTKHLGHSEALTLLLFGTFGVIFSPGGLGAYPLILGGILTGTYGVDEISSFALPWLSWTSQFAILLLLGVASLIVLPIINKNKNVVS
ncbi:MAG: flippase-like domain-containing protein [Bacteroidia bacterium]|nr:flippase-like domain-containing protein [Bacteroidia bacterium]